MHKVLYVPLDDRPCNYHYPPMLAKISDDMEMVTPPFSLMGRCKTPADTDKIWDWVFENATGADYAILSVDTLVYGNIIHSRIHQRTMDEINSYLKKFETLKEQNPNLKIEAFNLVARVSAYNNSFEDPDYWESYGRDIWRCGCLVDRIQRGYACPDEEKEYEALYRSVPEEYMKDFLSRREKDRYVNLKSVDYVKTGVFHNLVIPKDDTAEFGYAAMDQSVLAEKIRNERVMDRIMIYPGADEVGSVLLARVFNEIHQWSPKIYTRYSSQMGSFIVPCYEDRPMGESIKAQITSLGGVIVGTPGESDLLFAVHSPGAAMEEAGTQENKSLTYSTHLNLHEFFKYIKYYKETFNKPVALADVAFCNGADIEMMQHAHQAGILNLISAYGGWNTTENTNGMCLAHICIHTYYAQKGFTPEKEKISLEFLVRKIVEDYLFQAMLIKEASCEVEARYPGKSPYYCEDIEPEMAEFTGSRLNENIRKELDGSYLNYKIEIDKFYLPWKRVHELGFVLNLN